MECPFKLFFLTVDKRNISKKNLLMRRTCFHLPDGEAWCLSKKTQLCVFSCWEDERQQAFSSGGGWEFYVKWPFSERLHPTGCVCFHTLGDTCRCDQAQTEGVLLNKSPPTAKATMGAEMVGGGCGGQGQPKPWLYFKFNLKPTLRRSQNRPKWPYFAQISPLWRSKPQPDSLCDTRGHTPEQTDFLRHLPASSSSLWCEAYQGLWRIRDRQSVSIPRDLFYSPPR